MNRRRRIRYAHGIVRVLPYAEFSPCGVQKLSFPLARTLAAYCLGRQDNNERRLASPWSQGSGTWLDERVQVLSRGGDDGGWAKKAVPHSLGVHQTPPERPGTTDLHDLGGAHRSPSANPGPSRHRQLENTRACIVQADAMISLPSSASGITDSDTKEGGLSPKAQPYVPPLITTPGPRIPGPLHPPEIFSTNSRLGQHTDAMPSPRQTSSGEGPRRAAYASHLHELPEAGGGLEQLPPFVADHPAHRNDVPSPAPKGPRRLENRQGRRAIHRVQLRAAPGGT